MARQFISRIFLVVLLIGLCLAPNQVNAQKNGSVTHAPRKNRVAKQQVTPSFQRAASRRSQLRDSFNKDALSRTRATSGKSLPSVRAKKPASGTTKAKRLLSRLRRNFPRTMSRSLTRLMQSRSKSGRTTGKKVIDAYHAKRVRSSKNKQFNRNQLLTAVLSARNKSGTRDGLSLMAKQLQKHQNRTGNSKFQSRFNQASKSKSEPTTRSRQLWGATRGSSKAKNLAALKHFRQIYYAPGQWNKVTYESGKKYIEKQLPDGRGIRLNTNHSFVTFIDQKR